MASAFDPSKLGRPLSASNPIYASSRSVGGRDDGGTHGAGEQIVGYYTVYDSPWGPIMVEQDRNGALTYATVGRGDGSREQQVVFEPGANGTFTERQMGGPGSMFEGFNDPQFQKFLLVAGAGIGAAYATGAAANPAFASGAGEGGAAGFQAGAVHAGLQGAGQAQLAGQGATITGAKDQAGLDALIEQQNAKYGVTPAGDAALGAGAGAAAGTAASNIPQWLQDLGITNIPGALQNAGQLALIARMYDEQKGNAQEWRDFMGKATPDLGFYQGKLRNAYENPADWLKGPEYQAAQNIVHNKLQRSDAAGGRLANDFGRQQQLQDHAMSSLNEYRSGLGGLVNQQQNTSTGQGSNALQNAQNQESEWMRNLMNWMSGQQKG